MNPLHSFVYYYYGQKCTYSYKGKKVKAVIIAIAGNQVVCVQTKTKIKSALLIKDITLLLYPVRYAAKYRNELGKIFGGEFSVDVFLDGIINGKFFAAGWDFNKIIRAINLLRANGIDCDGLIEAGLAVAGNTRSLYSQKISII